MRFHCSKIDSDDIMPARIRKGSLLEVRKIRFGASLMHCITV